MRYFVFALIFILTSSVYAADIQPAGTAEAENRAEQASTARAERDIKRAAQAEAERKAAAEAAERRAAEETERAAKEAAERKAAEEAAHLAKQEAERKAAEEAARLAKQEAERKAAEEAARLAKEEAEREAQAALARAATTGEAISSETESCSIPVTVQDQEAARGIVERARADAETHAKISATLTKAAQDSVVSLASAYALDQGTVNKVYFSALCQKLYEMSLSPFSLKSFLTRLAAFLNVSYPASGGEAVTLAPAQAQPEAAPPKAESTTQPEAAVAPKAEQTGAARGTSGAANKKAESNKTEETAKPAETAEQEFAVSGDGDREQSLAASSEDAPASETVSESQGASDAGASQEENPAPNAVKAQAASGSPGPLGEEECRALGVLGDCPDLNDVLGRLLEKPLQYNHPKQMLLGEETEIGLVLRTDWEGKDLPDDISDELKGLPGDIKEGLSKITQIMSAELSGRNFEISPSGRQEQTIVPPTPASWNWRVKPVETGKDQTLKLRLFAHIQSPRGTMPPILVKTLDATIDVDVTTWDWFLAKAQTLEPIYAIFAALLGLLTAIITFIFARRRRAAEQGRSSPESGGSFGVPNLYKTFFRKSHGPVIGDLSQSTDDNRTRTSPPSSTGPAEKPDSGSEPDKS